MEKTIMIYCDRCQKEIKEHATYYGYKRQQQATMYICQKCQTAIGSIYTAEQVAKMIGREVKI